MGPVLRLNPLVEEEILILLQRLAEIHAFNYGYEQTLTNRDLKEFVREIVSRLGAEALLTPGEIVRDFISVVNVLYQNPNFTFKTLIHGTDFKPTSIRKNININVDEDDDVAEISL